MKPPNPRSAAHVIAESIRTELGTDAVILITPGSPKYAVVVAQAPDNQDRPASTAAQPGGDPDDGLQQSERLAFSVEEAATALGLSRELIYSQLRTGRLKSLKVGRRRIITRQHIEEFLAGQ